MNSDTSERFVKFVNSKILLDARGRGDCVT